MKIDEDFELTQNDIKYKDKDVVACVKIKTGEFKDVEFHFGEIKFAEEENPDGTFSIDFNYDIMSEQHKLLEGNQMFETQLGEILNELLKHALDEAEKRYKNELGTKDTETPDIG